MVALKLSSNTSAATSTTGNAPDTQHIHDVLIIGAGPAGSMLACTLSRLGIRAAVFDQEEDVHTWGRGDALLPRTVEILSQLGNAHPGTSVGDSVISRSTIISALAGYNASGSDGLGSGVRQPMLSLLDVDQQQIYGIRQGRVEQSLLEDYERTALGGPALVYRPYRFTKLDYARNEDPIAVTFDHGKTGQELVVKARFVIGADGGRSMMRKALQPFGITFDGSTPEDLWCAIDLVGVTTDFPDTRNYW